MATFSFGAVVLVPFPFTDQQSAKQRPAVIVSSDAYHRARRDLILMPITSQLRGNTFGDVFLQDQELARLLMPSAVKPVLATLDQSQVMKVLGRLSDRDRHSLKTSIMQLIGQEQTGKTRNAPDMMIAAIAEVNQCVVVTDNERDFEGIALVNPIRA